MRSVVSGVRGTGGADGASTCPTPFPPPTAQPLLPCLFPFSPFLACMPPVPALHHGGVCVWYVAVCGIACFACPFPLPHSSACPWHGMPFPQPTPYLPILPLPPSTPPRTLIQFCLPAPHCSAATMVGSPSTHYPIWLHCCPTPVVTLFSTTSPAVVTTSSFLCVVCTVLVLYSAQL